MLLDRSATDQKFQRIFRAAERAEHEGHFRILQVADGQVLWESEDGRIILKIVHPSFSDNTRALISGQPNKASGLIVLEYDSRCLFAWPGDLEIRTVAAKLNRVSPGVLFGPHHGAPSDYPSKAVRRRAGSNAGALKSQVRESVATIQPERTFISVGTKNQFHHPRPGYIQLLAQSSSHVVCSQLTYCCERRRVIDRMPVFQGAAALGLRPCRSGVSCRGAMRFYLVEGQLVPDEFDSAHRQRVTSLLRPQCLKGWLRQEPLPVYPREVSSR